jgi:hypothetical protein
MEATELFGGAVRSMLLKEVLQEVMEGMEAMYTCVLFVI